MKRIIPFSMALALSTSYAALLATRRGRAFRKRYTWLSVVVGVAGTLGCLALANRKSATDALLFFAVTGTPIVALCVNEEIDRGEALRSYLSKGR